MASDRWTIAKAKARFSEVINRAQADGPQVVTRRGKTAAVIVAAAEWEKRVRRVGTLAEFFATSPLRNSGLKLRRRGAAPRKVEL